MKISLVERMIECVLDRERLKRCCVRMWKLFICLDGMKTEKYRGHVHDWSGGGG